MLTSFTLHFPVADVLTPEQRKRNMASIRNKDTAPEILVRSLIHNFGYRYSLNDKYLSGKPDIVLRRYHKIVFVHGCFWHMHNCKYGRVTPATNRTFWQTKRRGNVERDKKNIKALRKEGWKILVVWECQTRATRMIWLRTKLLQFLRSA